MSTTTLDLSAYGRHRFHAVAGTVHAVRIERRAVAGEIFSGRWELFVLVEQLDTQKRYFVRRSSLHDNYSDADREADAQALAQAYSEEG